VNSQSSASRCRRLDGNRDIGWKFPGLAGNHGAELQQHAQAVLRPASGRASGRLLLKLTLALVAVKCAASSLRALSEKRSGARDPRP
jgi:hypothetical protein